ncbi:zinc finger CCCH domain-containing protein 18-like isoform X2 [Wolffia australiana]
MTAMDFSEATKIVFGRIQAVEPDLVSKIVGYLLLKDYGDREMIRLAFGPDSAVLALVNEAKAALPALALPAGAVRAARRPPGLPELPAKPCHYFLKGYCKHGSSCRFYHGQNGQAQEAPFLVSSPETLEFELAELLKCRGGQPVSISTLPMLYFERYGKMLQAEGYLTESQRHGKAGLSLTKLLARLNSVRIIDRPHGQHSVVLAEDAGRLSDPVAGSQQIYLTFPAESEFSEDDVSNYFKQFGAVRDVRIPCQQKRMFGFVTFERQETAQFVLAQGNPHYVCGARVLVKPYKEKSRLGDRKLAERIEQQTMYHVPQYAEMDPEVYPVPQFSSHSSRFLEEQMLELRNLRLSELWLLSQTANFGENGEDFASTSRLKTQLDQINSGFPSNDDSVGLPLPDSPFASPSMANGISTVI